MGGHSHWKNIKYQKQASDTKKSGAFSKIVRQISIAAKEGDGDPTVNPRLRLAIEMAKKMNMPSENIERAIKKGTGELEGVNFQEILCEAYGPRGTALLIEGITDNKNRALSEIKRTLSENGGKLVETGAVKWLFERKGVISLRTKDLSEYTNKENLELKVIEAGAEDIKWEEDAVEIYTKMEDLEGVKKNLEMQGIQVESTVLEWFAKEKIRINEKDKETAQKLFDLLEGLDSVQEIYSNLKI